MIINSGGFKSNTLYEAFSADITELIRQRYSCRTCRKEPVHLQIKDKLEFFARSLTTGPFGTPLRFMVSVASGNDTEELRGLGTYGFIRNPAGFIIGAAGEGKHNLEDFGYAMESLVLYASQLGLGTCWLGGSFTRSSFSNRLNLTEGEILPAVVSIGYATEESRSNIIRRIARSDQRLPWEKLFFDGDFQQPLKKQSAGKYEIPLEMVRLAPSASNKQPWRIVKDSDSFHFFLQRNNGKKRKSYLERVLGTVDLPRVDMGIALCHFELALKMSGISGMWTDEHDGGSEGCEYTATWKVVPG